MPPRLRSLEADVPDRRLGDGAAPHRRANGVAQMRKGILEYCVLAIVARDARYGRELADTLSDVTARGTIYPLLARLRRRGLVSCTLERSPQGPPRRYYRLTAAGHDALTSFTRDWTTLTRAVDRLTHTR